MKFSAPIRLSTIKRNGPRKQITAGRCSHALMRIVTPKNQDAQGAFNQNS